MPRRKENQAEKMEDILQKLIEQQQQQQGNEYELDESGDEFLSDDEGSVCSMPELQDLQGVVFSRYEKYHPKSLIPDEEKLVTLYLTEFNNAFCDLEEDFEEEEDEISHELLELREELKNLKKKKRGGNYAKKKKQEIKLLEENQREIKKVFLKQKDELERFYCQMCINAIQQHPEVPSELTSILTLLEKNASCLHAICLHLSHFSYIDSDLEEDSEGELASLDGESGGEEEMPSLPHLTQETLDFQFGKSTIKDDSTSSNVSSSDGLTEEEAVSKKETSSSKAI